MTHTTISIKTDDGSAPAHVFRPESVGPHPAALIFMDGIGMRPALYSIGERLAAHGYHALMPDMFYRMGPYEAPNAVALFSNPEAGKAWWGKVVAVASADAMMRDTRAYLAHFQAQSDVIQGKVGVTGYCMGGRLAIVAAETYPDVVVAAAAYHPGGLVVDAPDSPHKHVDKIKGQIFVGAAKEDAHMNADQQQTLRDAFAAAHVVAEVVQFNAKHGWVPGDTPIHDAAETEHHYETLFALFDRMLR